MTERTPEFQMRQHHRIHTEITRSAILHVEDALEIGKLRLLLFRYRRGEGAQASAVHYLDLADARVLFSDLATGRLQERFVDYKGTPGGRDGRPLSRVLKVEDRAGQARNPIVLEVRNGPGKVTTEGAVQPNGEPDAVVAVLLGRWEARRLALAVLAHLAAWETSTFGRRTQVAPSQVKDGERLAVYGVDRHREPDQ